MTDEQIQQLAEERYPTRVYEIGNGHPGSPYFSQLEKKKAFIAGCKAVKHSDVTWDEILEEVFSFNKTSEELADYLFSKYRVTKKLSNPLKKNI